MMADWKTMRLTDFVWFQRGFDLPQNKFSDGGIPVYGSTSILGYHNVAKVKAPGIITGRSGTLGKFQYSLKDFWPHNTTLWVKEFKGNDSKFAFYLLKCLDFTVFNSGGAVPSLNRNLLNAYVVNVPPLNTQRKIASILSGYDDVIENNLKRINILEEMAQQIYEEWFVRMRFPRYETAVFDENGLPKGWEKVKLGNLGEYLNGFAFKPNDFEGTGFPIIKIKEMKAGLAIDTPRNNGNRVPEKYYVNTGDILFSWSATLDVVIWGAEKGFVNQHLFKVTPKNGIAKPFVFYSIKKSLDIFDGLTTGATMKHIKRKELDFVEIGKPTKVIMDLFAEKVNPLFSSILNLQSQNQRLREARDILLPRLMMGMIDVSENSLQNIESLETKPVEAKIIPLTPPKKEASKEFKEAVLIACLTERFGSEKYPLGRKRYTKLSYLFHRYSDNKIQDYLRKAAGPYNPKTKYAGPEKIALNSKYIQNWKSDNGTTGFVVAEKIEDANKYFSNYWQISDLDWLTTEFKFKSNDELELLATVDNSLIELSKKNLEFTSANVLDIIKSEKEWEAKLERTIFSDANVERAIGFLRGVLKYN